MCVDLQTPDTLTTPFVFAHEAEMAETYLYSVWRRLLRSIHI